jgi:hypothetical protein
MVAFGAVTTSLGVKSFMLRRRTTTILPRCRPKPAGGRKTDPTIRTHFHPWAELRRTADERERREGRTVSELAGEALERYLAE